MKKSSFKDIQDIAYEEDKPIFINDLRDEYVKVRERNANRKSKALLSYQNACDNAFQPDFETHPPVAPKQPGLHVFEDFDVAELVDYIDWTPFFISWELAGKFPRILEDEVVGEAARDLFNDAQAMLKRIIDEKLLTANAVIGFWPAASDGDDVIVYTDETRKEERTRLYHLRQQTAQATGRDNNCLSDYIAPAEAGIEEDEQK